MAKGVKRNIVKNALFKRIFFCIAAYIVILSGVISIETCVKASEIEVENINVLNESDYQDENYSYSYHTIYYMSLIKGVYTTKTTSGHKRVLLKMNNADKIEFTTRGEFYCGHKSTCAAKTSFSPNPISVTINIGNGKVIKTFDVEQKEASSTTVNPFCSKSVILKMDDLAKYNLREEVVDITWSDSGFETCPTCGYTAKKGFQIGDVLVTDYRGICHGITNDSNAEENMVTVNASVDKYVHRCEWYARFENGEELKLHDGVMENGMIVTGANSNHMTIHNIPLDIGKVIEMSLLTYDENGQGLTNLKDGERPYRSDIYVSMRFITKLKDKALMPGQVLSLDLSEVIPKDTYSIRWQQSKDGVTFSDTFPQNVFQNRIYSLNNALFRINGVTKSMDGYSFRCVCTDAYGRKSISDSVKIYVLDNVFYYNNIPVTTVYINGKKVL